MGNPNKQREINSFSRDPNTMGLHGVNAQFGIQQADGSWWRYSVPAGAWSQILAPVAQGGTFAPVAMCESLNLAVANSAIHYFHVTQACNIRTIAVAVNGTTINSAADVVVTLSIVGGAAIGVVNLPTGTAAGIGVSTTINPVVALPVGSVVRAIVTTAATAAAGTGSVSLGLYTA